MHNSTSGGGFFHAGVDWVTLSGMGGDTTEELAWRSDRLLQEEFRQGNNKRPWGMSGFNGFKCGHVQYGWRGKEVMVRLGGDVAAEHWRDLYRVSDNCSRIDCQVTVNNGEDPGVIIRRAYQRARAWARGQPKGGGVSILETTNGPSTIYFNRRVSDRFGRIYDKGAQSKLEAYQGAVRWEVEFKNRSAKIVSTTLAASDRDEAQCVEVVDGFMSKRRSSWHPRKLSQSKTSAVPTLSSEHMTRPMFKSLSDADRQLTWLRHNVSRTVQDLLERGLGEETLSALGLILNDDVRPHSRAES